MGKRKNKLFGVSEMSKPVYFMCVNFFHTLQKLKMFLWVFWLASNKEYINYLQNFKISPNSYGSFYLTRSKLKGRLWTNDTNWKGEGILEASTLPCSGHCTIIDKSQTSFERLQRMWFSWDYKEQRQLYHVWNIFLYWRE